MGEKEETAEGKRERRVKSREEGERKRKGTRLGGENERDTGR